MCDGVIFDVDGTLLDSMPVWNKAGVQYLAQLGIRAEAGLSEKLFALTLEESARYIQSAYHVRHEIRTITAGINDLIMQAYAQAIPFKAGAAELLASLAEHDVPFAAATASDRCIVEAAFRRLGVLGLFRGIITAGETGCGKDRPDMYIAAAGMLGTAPGCTWVFEDALHAARTARSAGFKVAAVFDETSRASWPVLSALADYRVRTAGDFKDFICMLS